MNDGVPDQRGFGRASRSTVPGSGRGRAQPRVDKLEHELKQLRDRVERLELEQSVLTREERVSLYHDDGLECTVGPTAEVLDS